jgi:hypothetical protein
LDQALGKTGLKPGFPAKSKEAVPKTEVLEQPRVFMDFQRKAIKPANAAVS